MKKAINTLIMLLLTATLFANNGVAIKHTRSHTTIVTVTERDKLLLLPIEESMGESTLRIVHNNTLLEVLHVRLAYNKIDYYVPLDIARFPEGDLAIEVRTFPDERQRVGNYICWDKIRTANTFDAQNREKYRPVYHHTPAYGWMNDPNGMFYDEQTKLWHLYYQYNPYGSMWGNMHWGHSISADLAHWTPQPIAIRPTAWGTIFSGNTVIDKNNAAGYGENAVIAFYTTEGEAQMQNMAYSTDGGATFIPYPNNPILTADIWDFRDPNVVWCEAVKRWIMVVASGQEIRFYSSANFKDWTYESAFGNGYGNHKGVWECPDLMQIDGKWVLLVNINPGGPMGGSATQYFIGDFDGKQFTTDCKDEKWLDYGKDHYATVSFYAAPENRRTVIAWMSNWQYANQLPVMQYRSQNSLPRDLFIYTDSYEQLRLGAKPSAEAMALKGKPTKQLKETAVVEIEVRETKKPVVIALTNNKGEEVVMTYDFDKQVFAMNREKSGIVDFSQDFPTTTTVPLFVSKKKHKLLLFIDKCSIEAFDAEGHWAMTNLVFPTEPYNKIIVKGGSCKIYDINF